MVNGFGAGADSAEIGVAGQEYHCQHTNDAIINTKPSHAMTWRAVVEIEKRPRSISLIV